MKKVKDFLTMTEGIFNKFYELYTDKYEQLFDDLLPEDLDIDLYNICANRYASNYLLNLSLEQLIDIIIARYYENWLKIKDLLLTDYDPLNPYYRETVTDQKTTNSSSSDNKQTVDDGLFGFNSSVASPKDTSEINTTGKNEGEGGLNSKVTVKGNNGNFVMADLIDRELEARKMSLVQVVLNDVEQLITLSIY